MDFHYMLPILVIIVLFPFLIKIIFSFEFYYRKSSLAKKEYKNARGTAHKNLLKKSLNNLTREIQKTKNELDSAIRAEKDLQLEKTRELEKAATIYIFESDFTSIPGIGKILKDRIRRTVFDGTLQSLHRAWGVHGIGESKAYEIRKWIEKTARRLPYVLNGHFPNKLRIVNKYDDLIRNANNRIKNIESTYKPMIELENIAKTELDKLNQVKSSIFKKSYDGDIMATEAVTEYHLGCFPEWRRIPGWFITLMEAYG